MDDVAIVGAGPVGLFAALLLGQRGVSVTLYERWPTFYPLPRACGVDHEIVRMLQGAGLMDEMEPLLDPVIGSDKTYKFLDKSGDTILQIDWNRPGASGWAQMNMFYQPDFEAVIASRVEQLPNVTIQRGRELTHIEQVGDHVSLTFKSTEGTSDPITVAARYVIGADGARSKVRELCKIEQTDLGFQYDWLVVDVVPHGERVWDPYVVQHCNPERPTTLVGSGPGRRRWEFMRMPNETIEQLEKPEKAWELLAASQITPENATLERQTVYTFRGSWAKKWRMDRILLVGDAAHLMPPFLGQGLCSGMRDAMALAWRLPMILKGEAPETLLASYGTERSEHVQEIIHQAVEMGRLICMLDPEEVAARDEQMKAAIKDPSLALKPPPEPRLGDAGLYQANDQHAGHLSRQGHVRHGEKSGLFDDVAGKGWQLFYRNHGQGLVLSQESRKIIEQLNLIVAEIGSQSGFEDLDGTYSNWFDDLGCDAILVRPDFYIFGTSSIGGIDTILGDLRAAIHKGAEHISLTGHWTQTFAV